MSSEPSAAELFQKIIKGDDPQDQCKQQFIKELVDTTKKFIKSDSNNGLTKNRALKLQATNFYQSLLKQLIGSLMTAENVEFVTYTFDLEANEMHHPTGGLNPFVFYLDYVGIKLMKKLAKFAIVDTNLQLDQRGKKIFGLYEVSNLISKIIDENQAQKFYNYTLECIQKWSNQFSIDPQTKGESVFKQTFKQLESNRVIFSSSQQGQQTQQLNSFNQGQSNNTQQQNELVDYRSMLSLLKQIKKRLSQLENMLNTFYNAFKLKKPPNEVLQMIRNQWNAIHDIGNFLDLHNYKYCYDLDLLENQRIRKNAQFVLTMQNSMASIIKDPSKLNESVRLTFLDNWSRIFGSASQSATPVNTQNNQDTFGSTFSNQYQGNNNSNNNFNQQNIMNTQGSNNNSPFNLPSNNTPIQKINQQSNFQENPFDLNYNKNQFNTTSSQSQTPIQQGQQAQNFNQNNFFDIDYSNNSNTQKKIDDSKQKNYFANEDDDFFSSANDKKENFVTQNMNQQQQQPASLKSEFKDFEFDFMGDGGNDSQIRTSNDKNINMSSHPPLPPKKLKTNQSSASNSHHDSRRSSLNNSQSSQKGGVQQAQNYQQQNKSPINNQFSSSSNAFQRKDSYSKQNSQEYNNQISQQQQQQQQPPSNANNFGFDINFSAQSNANNDNKLQRSGTGNLQSSDNNNFGGFDFGFGGFGDINPKTNSVTSSQKMNANVHQQEGQNPHQNQFEYNEFNNYQNSQSQGLNQNSNAQNFNDFFFGEDNNNVNQQNPNIVESQFQNSANLDAFQNSNNASLHKDKYSKKLSHNNSQIQEKEENPLTISQKLELGGSEFNLHQLKISQEQQYKFQNNDLDDIFNVGNKHTSQQNSYTDFNLDFNNNNNNFNNNNINISNNNNNNNYFQQSQGLNQGSAHAQSNQQSQNLNVSGHQNQQQQIQSEQQSNNQVVDQQNLYDQYAQTHQSTHGNFSNQQHHQQQIQSKTDFMNWSKQGSKDFQVESNNNLNVQGVYKSKKNSFEDQQIQGGVMGSNYFTSGVNNPMASSVGSEQSKKHQQDWNANNNNFFDMNFENNFNQNKNEVPETKESQISNSGFDLSKNNSNFNQSNNNNSNNYAQNDYFTNDWQFDNNQSKQDKQDNNQKDDDKVQFWMQQKVQQQMFGNQYDSQQQQLTKNSSFDKSHQQSTGKKNNHQNDAFGLDDFGEISEATGGEDSKIEAQKYGFDFDQKTNEKEQYLPNDSRRSDDFDDLLPSDIDLVKLNKRNLQDQQFNNMNTKQEEKTQSSISNQVSEQKVQNANSDVAIHKQFIKTKQQILSEQIDYEKLKKTFSDSQSKDSISIKPYSPQPYSQSSNLNNKRRSSIEEYALKKQMETQTIFPKPFDFEAQKLKSEERRRSEGQAVLYQQVLSLQQNQLKLVTINEEEHPPQTETNEKKRNTLQLFQANGQSAQYPDVNLILPSVKDPKVNDLVVLQEGQLRNPLQTKTSFTEDDEDDYLDSPEVKKKESDYSHDNNNKRRNHNNSASIHSQQQPNSNPQIILAESDIIPYPDENSQGSRYGHDHQEFHHKQNILESEVIKPPQKDNNLSPNILPREILQSEYILQNKSQTIATKDQNNNFKPTLTESYVEMGEGIHSNKELNLNNYYIQNYVQSETNLPYSEDESAQQHVGSTVENRLSVEKSMELAIEEIKFDLDDFPLLENQLNSPRAQVRKRQLSTINEEQEQGEDPDQSSFHATQEIYDQRIEQIKAEQANIHEQLAEIRNKTIQYEERYKNKNQAKKEDLDEIKNQLKAMLANQQKIKTLKDRFKQNLQFIMLIEYKKAALSVEKVQSEVFKLQEISIKASSIQNSQKQQASSDDPNAYLIESLKKEIQDLKQQMQQQQQPGQAYSRKNSQEGRKYSESELAAIEDLRVQMSKLKSDFEIKYNEQSQNLSNENKSTMIEFMEKLSAIENNIVQQKEDIQRLSHSQNDIQKQFMSISRSSHQFQNTYSPRSQEHLSNFKQEERRDLLDAKENKLQQKQQQQQLQKQQQEYDDENQFSNNPSRKQSVSEQGEAELFPRNQFFDNVEQKQVDENEYKSVRSRDNQNQEEGINYLTPSKSSQDMQYSPIILNNKEQFEQQQQEIGFKNKKQFNQTDNQFFMNNRNHFENARMANSQYQSLNPNDYTQQQQQQMNDDENNMNNSMLRQLYERTASHTLIYEQNPHLQKIYQDPYVLMKAFEAQKQSQIGQQVGSPYDMYGSFQNNRIQQRLKESVNYGAQSGIFNEAINFSINSYKVNYVVSNYNMNLKDKEKFQHNEQMLSEYNRYYDPLLELSKKQLGKEYYPNNEWFEKNLKQFVKRINIEKRIIKDSIINSNCIILETFDLQVAAKYAIVKTTNSSGQQDPRYPSQILKIQLTYTNKLGMDINNLLIILASAKGYETVLADPPKILQNLLKPYETITQDVYLPNYKANSQLLISQFSYNTGFRQSRVGALIPSTPNKFMDFNFINKDQFNQMWEESKDTMIYNSPVYINTHIIQSCEDFRSIYPLMIEIVEGFEQYKVSWRELGGAFTLLNDVYPNITYLIKICYSYDERVYFQLSSIGQDQIQSFNVKKILASILELFYFLYCE